jgi:hypothetical protein
MGVARWSMEKKRGARPLLQPSAERDNCRFSCPYIFDAFRRGRGTIKEEGSGLGLAAVKAIIRGHRGHIHVEGEIGNGSVFP